ncbi:MAG: acyl-CoA-binding protein [Anaerolineae bacterium]|nr:acyl-CoA-binding protein [Anaerolineae bacterium]
MDDLQSRFEQAAAEVQGIATRPSNEVLLKLYALYKQSTAGDVSGKRPGITNLAGRAKYDAWQGVKGMPRAEAMEAYIGLVDELKAAG